MNAAAHPVFRAMAHRHLVLLTLALLVLVGPIRAQVTINIDNSSYQYFAVDAARNFLYVAEASNAGTKHLSVVNTLTNTVVGTYSFSSGGYTSQVTASGTNVFWADQGIGQVKVIAVSGGGTPTLSRNDSASQATGIAALGTTYAVSKQGGGDLLDINLISTGAASFANINLSGVAGQVYADANTNRYYARSSSSFKIINGSTGSILGTLSGLVMAIDPSAGHNYIYLQNSGVSTRLDQLAGTVTNNTVTTYYDFGAAFNDVAVNSATGDIFIAQNALNRVVQLNSSMAFVQQFNVASPESIAFAGGQLYVHGTGQAYLTAIPEPATWAALLGGLGLVAAVLRRRGQAVPANLS